MGAGSEEEPSEEIRLARATLVGEICARSKDSDVLASFADEMADVIAKTNANAANQQAGETGEDFFASLDRNADGVIDYAEFLHALETHDAMQH